MFILLAIILIICAIFELIYNLNFIKRIIVSVFTALTFSYLISPIIPYGADIDTILSYNFTQNISASFVNFILIFFGLIVLFMFLLILFNKTIGIFIDFMLTIFYGIFAFIFSFLSNIVNNLSIKIPALIQTQNFDNVNDLFNINPINSVVIFIIIFIIVFLIAQTIFVIKNKKIYHYINNSLFLGMMCCFFPVFCMIGKIKSTINNITNLDKDSLINFVNSVFVFLQTNINISLFVLFALPVLTFLILLLIDFLKSKKN